MGNQEVIVVPQADMLQALSRAEVDIQVATAKKYPRDVQAALNKIATYATLDKETAEECFYILRRKGAGGQDSVIEGLSVRMAEIIAEAWGNLRIATRIIGNDGKMITAQAVCHDLESNVAVSKEVKRRITDRNGRTFSEDMQVVTGNAASSIAFRNAVLSVIPKAVTKRVINEVKKVAIGQSIDLEQSRQNLIEYFRKIGVTQEQLFFYLEVNTIEEIDKGTIFELRATANAIKEGTTTVEEIFIKPFKEAQLQEQAKEQTSSANKKAEDAIAKATGEVPENVDPETGEITTDTKKGKTNKKK